MVYKGIVYQSTDGKVNEINTYDSTFIRFTIPRIGESVRCFVKADNETKDYEVQNVIYDIHEKYIFIKLKQR